VSLLRCVRASTPHEIGDAQRVRYRVYVEEERLLSARAGHEGREIDERDDDRTAVHFVAYDADEPVGTVRLLTPRPDPELRLGLELESTFALAATGPGIVPAEVTRYCVTRSHRGTRVAAMLHALLRAESGRRGITHWFAAANMQTDSPEDAALVYELVRRRRLVDQVFAATPRAPATTPRSQRLRCYTNEERRRAGRGDDAALALPRPVALFAARMGARYIGPPAYDAYFGVFALPLVASPHYSFAGARDQR
jgi:putative hemolysin